MPTLKPKYIPYNYMDPLGMAPAPASSASLEAHFSMKGFRGARRGLALRALPAPGRPLNSPITRP